MNADPQRPEQREEETLYLTGWVLIHDGQLGAVGGQVQAADGGADLEDVDGEGVVDEDLEDLAVFKAQQEAFPFRRSAHNLQKIRFE